MRRVVLLLLCCVPAAGAHADSGDWEGTWELAPGERVEATRPVHWHRVFGTWEASGPVVFEVQGVGVEEGRAARFDHLVDCCEATWSDVGFALHNPGDAPVMVTGSFHFVHDNLAVVVDDSEPGAWWQTLLIFVLMLAVPAWRARATPAADEGAARWLLANRVLHTAAWVLALALAVTGMVRFHAGPVVGSMGATAGAAAPLGDFLNLHAVLMLALMGWWGAGYACLAGARRRGAATRDGSLYLAGMLVVGTAAMVEVGANAIAWILLLVPAALVVVDQWGSHLRRPWTDRPARG